MNMHVVPREEGLMTVEAELTVPAVTAQVVRFHLTEPGNHILRHDECCWLDLCLTPRPENARACYRDRWGPHRFSRLGDIFLVPPGLALHTRSDGGAPQGSIICRLNADLLQTWVEGRLDWTDRRLEASLDIESRYIRTLLFRLGEEARFPGFGSEILAELIAGQVAIELGRYCESVTDAPPAGGLAAWRLRLIDERLRDVAAPPTLGELANICDVSVRQLTRGFRTSRGCSIGDFVAQARVENAKRLITTGASMKSIAYQLGFASPSSFSYAFRRTTGATPRQFRQRQARARVFAKA